MENFKKLNLDEGILKAIKEAGFSEPTEIQEKSIPLVIEGKDVLGSSATGSGKTLAFGSGIIQHVKKGHGVQALVLTPTRELAEQVSKSLKIFSKHYSFEITEVYGGVAMSPQIRALSRAEVVVGTPGRILDHLSRRNLDLKNLKFLVLDEADRMLDMGFIKDVETIIHACPKERQTLLFSATISTEIEHLSKRFMKNPVLVSAESYVDPSKLTHVYYDVPQNKKFSLLVNFLKQDHSGLIMVFCNTRSNTDFLARNLKRYNLHALAIHGGLNQNRRTSTMGSFHSGEILILICTDVAARGLDIPNVSHIYNYDIPKTSTEYIHRVGRTARAGKEGKAISLVTPRDYENFRKVCQDDSINIELEDMPEIEEIEVNFQGSRRGGFRKRSGGFRGQGRNRPNRNNSSSGRNRSQRGGGFNRRRRF